MDTGGEIRCTRLSLVGRRAKGSIVGCDDSSATTDCAREREHITDVDGANGCNDEEEAGDAFGSRSLSLLELTSRPEPLGARRSLFTRTGCKLMFLLAFRLASLSGSLSVEGEG